MFSKFKSLHTNGLINKAFTKSQQKCSLTFFKRNFSSYTTLKNIRSSLDGETILGLSIAAGGIATIAYCNKGETKHCKNVFEVDNLSNLLCDNYKFSPEEKEGFILISRAFLWDEESYPYFISNEKEAQSWFAEFTNNVNNYSSAKSLEDINNNPRKKELIRLGAAKLGVKFNNVTPAFFQHIYEEIITPKISPPKIQVKPR